MPKTSSDGTLSGAYVGVDGDQDALAKLCQGRLVLTGVLACGPTASTGHVACTFLCSVPFLCFYSFPFQILQKVPFIISAVSRSSAFPVRRAVEAAHLTESPLEIND